MDLTKTIEELRSEKEKLDRVIGSLEELQAGTASTVPTRSRPGRKSMSLEERREVSERMKQYWAGRRHQRQSRA